MCFSVHYGNSQTEFSGLVCISKLTVRYPRCRNTDTPNTICVNPFQDFASREFRRCEYKGIRPWAFWFPKCRSLVTYLHIVLSGLHPSGFWDWRVQEDWPLGFPVAKTPKHQGLPTLDLFRISYFGISRWVMKKSLTPRFSRETEHWKLIATPSYYHFGISRIGVSWCAQTRDLAPRPSGSRNSEIPTLRPAHLFQGFSHRIS
jgi:hypothetical protein